VLTTRGIVLAVGSLCAALAGLVYGVEEFVFLALAGGALVATGTIAPAWQRTACRKAIRLVVAVPEAEIVSGQSAVVELVVTNTGRRHLPPLLVGERDHLWTVTHPGLAQGARTLRRQRDARPQRPPAAWGFGGSEPARTRRERSLERRAVSGARGLPSLPPGGRAVTRFSVPSARRGVLTLSGASVWCRDPFGLAVRWVAQAPPAHVIVYPLPVDEAVRATRRGPRAGRHPETNATAPPANALSGDELSGLRPYAPGDRLTRLHWPSLARSGDLVVREFLEPDAGSLSILVDLRPAAHSGDSFERTISRAAGLGTRALAEGMTVELCTSAGDRIRIPAGAAARQTLLRALAMLGPAAAPPGVARRQGDRAAADAVWATSSAGSSAVGMHPTGDVVLLTTSAGAALEALPPSLRLRADTVVV
jgi:uncharacterized protein (DUF58 family)